MCPLQIRLPACPIEPVAAATVMALALATLYATPGLAQPGSSGEPAVWAQPKVQPELAGVPSPLRARDLAASPRPRSVVIERASAAAVSAGMTAAAGPGVPVKTGFRRAIAATATAAETAARLDWSATAAGGLAAALELSAPGARGLRLGILVERLPEGAILRFFAPGDAAAHAVPAEHVLAAVRRNRLAGDTSEAGQTYWSPVIEGDTITLEIELPPGVSGDAVEIAVPALSHLVKLPTEAGRGTESVKIGESGSCNVDVSCQAAWANDSKAVAKMAFVENGASFECSGTLVADNIAASLVPYFLTANHCISTQTVASTLSTYWFYRSTACNSGTLNPSYAVNTDGATLLYATTDTDSSFMRLVTAPPAGTTFSGWSTTAPTEGTTATSLHHPLGDMQKIAIGNLDAFADCSPPDTSGTFTCTTATQATGEYVNVTFSTGTAESGSSGSGLFIADGVGQHYLIGTYLGGSTSCANPTGSNRYGRFDRVYTAAVRQWLSGYQIPALGQTVDNTSLAWTTGGNGAFFAESGTAVFGGSALQSAAIKDGQSVFLATTITGPGTLTFYWKVSSEQNFDFLNVYLDGVKQTGLSGEVNWTQASITIPEGSHEVKWIYAKDGGVKAGSDAAWVDRVQYSAAPVTPANGLWAIDAERNGQPGRGFTIEVQHGVLVVTIFGYDASGGDAFYQASGSMNGNTFSGTLSQYRGGTTFGGAFKSATLAGTVGTISMTFTDSSHGTITLPGEAAKAFSKFAW